MSDRLSTTDGEESHHTYDDMSAACQDSLDSICLSINPLTWPHKQSMSADEILCLSCHFRREFQRDDPVERLDDHKGGMIYANPRMAAIAISSLVNMQGFSCYLLKNSSKYPGVMLSTSP